MRRRGCRHARRGLGAGGKGSPDQGVRRLRQTANRRLMRRSGPGSWREFRVISRNGSSSCRYRRSSPFETQQAGSSPVPPCPAREGHPAERRCAPELYFPIRRVSPSACCPQNAVEVSPPRPAQAEARPWNGVWARRIAVSQWPPRVPSLNGAGTAE